MGYRTVTSFALRTRPSARSVGDFRSRPLPLSSPLSKLLDTAMKTDYY